METKHGLCTFCHDEITAKWYWEDTDRWFAELKKGKTKCVIVVQSHYDGEDIEWLMCKRHLEEAAECVVGQ